MRVELQSAFVLHSRPFRDTSLIVDCLTLDYGRVSLLAKGARSAKSKQRHLLQPFLPLTLSWQGKSSLKTLTSVESQTLRFPLQGKHLYCGFYLNELLTRLLPEQDAHPEVMLVYQQALEDLAREPASVEDEALFCEWVLRGFERQLLQLLGYAIDFSFEALSSEPIAAAQVYRFEVDRGFVRIMLADLGEAYLNRAELDRVELNRRDLFTGEDLLALARHDYRQPQVLQAAKRLMRSALKPLLGHKPLQSRKLFMDMVSSH